MIYWLCVPKIRASAIEFTLGKAVVTTGQRAAGAGKPDGNLIRDSQLKVAVNFLSGLYDCTVTAACDQTGSSAGRFSCCKCQTSD
jgi:hypothetical protein